jgi:hypothetical protein
MLFTSRNEWGITTYTVCNDAGQCLIHTTDAYMARVVHLLSRGVDTNLRLTVGGDPGTRQARYPVFHHVRRYVK